MFRFAIIGCGKSAAAHATQISRIGKLVAVCDIVAKKADDLASQFGAKPYYDAGDLLNDDSGIDIVCVCSPNGCHAEHCIKSLQAGLHVLCEGPLCITTAAAWQMIETEKFCRKKLWVVNTVALNPAAIELKKQIDIHSAGQSFNFDLNCSDNTNPPGDWRNKVFPGGGALYTHFSRYINLLLFLFGEIDDVKGYCANKENLHLLETEDTGEASLKMKNGVLGEIHWNLNGKGKTTQKLSISKIKNPMVIESNQLNEIIVADEKAYELLYDNMINTITKHGQAASGLYHNMKTVEAIEKIYKAVSSNPS